MKIISKPKHIRINHVIHSKIEIVETKRFRNFGFQTRQNAPRQWGRPGRANIKGTCPNDPVHKQIGLHCE